MCIRPRSVSHRLHHVLVPGIPGIPEYLIAPVDDEFYADVGRICVVAAFLDDLLGPMLSRLRHETGFAHNNKNGGQLIKLCKAAAKENASPELRRDVDEVLDKASGLRRHRHAVAHSVWLQPGLGWRADVTGTFHPASPGAIYETDQQSLRELITRFATVIDEVRHLLTRADKEMWERGNPTHPMDDFMKLTSGEEGVSNQTLAASKAPWTTHADGSSELLWLDS
jgi:hypothetical protein